MRKGKHYNEKEKQHIIDHYEIKDNHELANDLQRTYSSVAKIMHKLGLTRGRAKYELYYHDKHIATGTVDELADELELSDDTIKAYIFDKQGRYNYYAKRMR